VASAEGDVSNDEGGASSKFVVRNHNEDEGLISDFSEEHEEEAEKLSLPVVTGVEFTGVVREESFLELNNSVVVGGESLVLTLISVSGSLSFGRALQVSVGNFSNSMGLGLVSEREASSEDCDLDQSDDAKHNI